MELIDLSYGDSVILEFDGETTECIISDVDNRRKAVELILE